MFAAYSLAALAGPGKYTAQSLVISYGAIVLVMTASASLARLPVLAAPFGALGRKSLQVYLLHWPTQLVMCAILIRLPAFQNGRLLFALLLMIGLAGPYLGARLMEAWKLRFLFELPRWRRPAPA